MEPTEGNDVLKSRVHQFKRLLEDYKQVFVPITHVYEYFAAVCGFQTYAAARVAAASILPTSKEWDTKQNGSLVRLRAGKFGLQEDHQDAIVEMLDEMKVIHG